MKKALMPLLIFSLFSFNYSLAQNQNLNSAESYFADYENYKGGMPSLTKAKDKIDLAIANESTSAKCKTWFYKGKIYLALFNELLKDEMNKSTETETSKKLLYAYNIVSPDYLDEALNAFQKEVALDEKKTYTNESLGNTKVITSNYSDKAYSCLVNKNYDSAIKFYEKAYEMKLKMNVTDTAALNNMAFAAVRSKNYKAAEGYYEKLIEIKDKPERCYLAIIQMFNDAEDTASVRKIIIKSSIAMPDSYALLIEKINLSLRDGKSAEAINSIDLALTKKPNNPELHLVLAQTYNKLAFPKDISNKDLKKPINFNELIKKAEDGYSKTIEIKPDYLIGLYSAGIFYNNYGADILKQSENIKDPKKVKIEEDKADALFMKAIPMLEKAHQLDPKDKDTIRTLKQLYAKTGQGDTEKYRLLNEELKK
jgi:Tfp pilus assembly protein PilF